VSGDDRESIVEAVAVFAVREDCSTSLDPESPAAWRRGVQALVAVVLSVVAMCVQVPAAASAGTGSYKTAKVTEAGVSFKYPSNWTVVPASHRDLVSQVNRIKKTDPTRARALKNAARVRGTGALFFARDLATATPGGGPNFVAVVFAEGAGFPSSLVEFQSVAGRQSANAGLAVVNTSTAMVSGTTAYRLDLAGPVTAADGSMQVVRTALLYVHTPGDSLSIVSVGAVDDAAGVAVIDRVLASVRHL
jgi:hypothetical protein